MTAQDGATDGGYYGSEGWPALMSAAQGFLVSVLCMAVPHGVWKHSCFIE